MTDAYALGKKLARLEAIGKEYRSLPREDDEILQFLKFAYQNPKAYEVTEKQDQRQRFRMAERIFAQAKNIKQLPEKQVIGELKKYRGMGKRLTLDSGIYESAEIDEERHATQLIYTVQRTMTPVFHYFLTSPGTMPTPEDALSFMNAQLAKRYEIPVTLASRDL